MNLSSPGTAVDRLEWTVYSMPATPSPPYTSNGCAEWMHHICLDTEHWTFRIPDWQLVRSQVAYLFNNWVPILPLAPRLKPLVFLNLCNKKKWSPNRLIFLFCIVMVKNLLNIFQTYVTVPAASSMGGLKTMFWEVYVRSFHWVSSGIIQLVGLLFSSHKSMILVIPSYTTSKKGAKDGHSCLPRNEQLLNK